VTEDHDLPLIVVPYGLGAAGPLDVVRAAEGLSRVVFTVDSRDPHVAATLPVLRDLARTIDVAESRESDLAASLGERPRGIVTFSESCLRAAARQARILRLRYHTPKVAEVLTSKQAQRSRLNRAGVTPVRQHRVAGPADVGDAVRVVGAPAVVKPVHGEGSRDTHRYATAAELRAGVADLLTARPGDDWVVEEALPSGRHPGGDWLGDYVSVESLVDDADIWHFAVTDKLPLARPFRETGMVTPSVLPDGMRSEVEVLAGQAVRAVGVTCGVTHTEIKLTPDGPRVIEVNGRLGGVVGRLMRRASDLDPLRLAIEFAVHGTVRPRRVDYDRAAIQFGVMAPTELATVDRIAGPRVFREVPGVWAVERFKRAGDVVDWRRGSLERTFTVWADAVPASRVPDVIGALRSVADRAVSFGPWNGHGDVDAG
jgi:biotin carboxylase